MSKPIRTKPEPPCPKCGARMVLRRPREGQDWDAFWGCCHYPHCKGTRQIQEDGLPEEDDPIEAYEED
ncbi:MAG TPA: topoisomerase DNA-binding C4 zinc finger domain-containing protein [Anaerolineae bacterium]|nr:topoisomerase DNA-binding C4 zinc finger domain-containing protein [Anaerolineae bacterium]